MGHSLFGLGDEYSDSDAAPPAPPAGVISNLDTLVSIPNLLEHERAIEAGLEVAVQRPFAEWLSSHRRRPVIEA
jgi:hypothetical protein